MLTALLGRQTVEKAGEGELEGGEEEGGKREDRGKRKERRKGRLFVCLLISFLFSRVRYGML